MIAARHLWSLQARQNYETAYHAWFHRTTAENAAFEAGHAFSDRASQAVVLRADRPQPAGMTFVGWSMADNAPLVRYGARVQFVISGLYRLRRVRREWDWQQAHRQVA
jgi:hypothetical protein